MGDRRAARREQRLNRAAALLTRGCYSESRTIVEQILRHDPSNRRAGFIRDQLRLQPELGTARALGRDGRLEDERQILCGLRQRFPREPEVYIWLASNAAARQRDGAAAGYARRAAELAPDDPAALFRAAWFGRHGDHDASRVYLERVKLLTDHSEPRFALHREIPYLEGLLAADEGRDADSLTLLQRAFRLDPANVGIAGALASVFVRNGRLADARDAVAVGLEHHPDDQGLRELADLVSGDSL